MSKQDKPLEKMMGLSHSMGAPTSEVGGAALDIKKKTEKLRKKLKKKKLNKSDKAKLLIYKAMVEDLIKKSEYITEELAIQKDSPNEAKD